jgi:hypothetical protein
VTWPRSRSTGRFTAAKVELCRDLTRRAGH